MDGRPISPRRQHTPVLRYSSESRTRWLTAISCLLAIGLVVKYVHGAERWPYERRTGAFLWHADFSLDEYHNLLNEMGSLQQDLIRELGVGQCNEPVYLFVFQDKNTYQGYLKQYFPKIPYRRAMFIKERGPGMVFAYRSSDLEIDVRHESTHALLHSCLPMVPLWLDEGLAEYFEMPASQRASHNPHLSSLKWQMRLGQVAKMEALEGMSNLSQMGRNEYRDSFAWVHFMLHGPREAHEELMRFLADIHAHSPPGKLSDRLRRKLPDLDRQFAAHLREWQ